MKTSRDYDHYFNYQEITQSLQDFAERYPDYSQLTSLGQTEEGREIWLMKITDTRSGSYEDKPGYVITGNLHAGEVTGSMNVLYFIDTLLTAGENDTHIQSLLKNYTVYAIPRISPDGAEFYLTTGGMCRSVNKLYPSSQLPPGIYGEDLDGDGCVRQMRIKDPLGMWKISKEDPRLMVHRDPDEKEGEFYSVFREGKVHGDPARHCFDAPDPYGNDFNRSFPINWATDNIQNGAGPYPLFNLETRALADFLCGHTNLCALVSYHTCAGVCLYPPATMPPEKAAFEDLERYKAVGKIVTDETTYPVYNIYDQFAVGQGRRDHGSFDDYVHFGRGIFCYTVECWDLDIQAGVPGKWCRPIMQESPDLHYKYEKDIIRWVDEHLGKDTFKPWSRFQHPQLGEVEIGGYDIKFVMQNPPIPYLKKEMERCSRFMLRQLATLPRITLDAVTVQKMDGFYEIHAQVSNLSYFPTYMTKEAVRLRVVKEDQVFLKGEGIEWIHGRPCESIGYLPGMSSIHSANLFGEFATFKGRPLTADVCWKIRARSGTKLTVEVRSTRGGVAAEDLILP